MSAVQSVLRAHSILAAVAEAPATLSELARRVDLPVSTTSRLLITLEECGAVERVEGLSAYRIGPSILSMAASASAGTSLAAVARPEMETLALEVGEAVALSVPAGHRVLYVSQVDTAHSVRVDDWVGRTVPLHLVSAGLVMLAWWDDKAVERFLSSGLMVTTTESVVDPVAIRERLEMVRDRGLLWTEGEFVEGITSVAVPVFDPSGTVVASLGVHGPSYRFERGSDLVESALTAAGARLSALL